MQMKTPLTLPSPARGEGIRCFAPLRLRSLNSDSLSHNGPLPLPLRERTEVRGVVRLYRKNPAWSHCLALAAFLALGLTSPVHAGWFDQLLGGKGTNSTFTALTVDEMTKGLREALAKGTEKAIADLGKTNGFLGNVDVKIPMPQKLQEVEKGLRMVKQDKYADEFITTMNHAAEAAVPEAGPIIGDAIRDMTVADAKNILNGPDDAATQYFRKVSEKHLK